MRATSPYLTLVAWLLCFATPVLAQDRDTAPVAASTAPTRTQTFLGKGPLVRIRLRRPARTYEAHALKIERDSLVLSLRGAQGERIVTIPRALVGRAWVSAGQARQTNRGAQIGAITGALLGLAVGAGAYTPCDRRTELCIAPESPLLTAAPGMALGAPIGAAIGALVGSTVVGERWQRVDPVTLYPTGKAAPPPFARGARVQLLLSDLPVTGTLLDLADTALVLRRDGEGDSLRLSLQALRDVRILRRQPSPRTILGLGVVGAALGGIVGCNSRGEDDCPRGIAIGATAGIGLGRLVQTDQWVRVPLPVVRWVALARNAGGD